MIDKNEKKINRAVLVGLNAHCLTKEENATESSMEELSALLETAGGETVGIVTQSKDSPDPRTFLGGGKCRLEGVGKVCKEGYGGIEHRGVRDKAYDKTCRIALGAVDYLCAADAPDYERAAGDEEGNYLGKCRNELAHFSECPMYGKGEDCTTRLLNALAGVIERLEQQGEGENDG